MPDSRRFWFSRKSPDAVTPETSPETPADKPTTLSSEDPPDITPSHAPTGESGNTGGNDGEITAVPVEAITVRRRLLPATRATTLWA
jgi:hypothetical protein